jgi:hypothetical protein
VDIRLYGDAGGPVGRLMGLQLQDGQGRRLSVSATTQAPRRMPLKSLVPNSTLDQTAGSHSLAAAGQRGRSLD